MVRARFATHCSRMFFCNARSKVDSARHDRFTPLSSARRCLESEQTSATAYRILTDAQLRNKLLLNPRKFGNQDDPRHVPSCLHPRRAAGTMVLPLAPISACHDTRPRAGAGIRHKPPESRARSNAWITCVLQRACWKRKCGAAGRKPAVTRQVDPLVRWHFAPLVHGGSR